ncbi:DUF2147 domain-containing protein [Flavobacteriaceae bacterium M23B6Z8]
MHKISISCFLFLVIFFISGSTQAQQIFGQWKTVDHETGEVRSIVEIYEEEDKVYGRIVEVLVKEKKGGKCTLCPGEKKNKPLKGLVIIEGLEKDEEAYEGGTVIDPAKGKKYRCKIWVDEEKPDILNVRGYVSFFYKTQQWIRNK